MQLLPGQLLLAQRLKRARTDMQGDVGRGHAHLREMSEHSLIKVQPGSRRGDGTGRAGIDGLVALAIGFACRAADVGWQRHFAVLLKIRHDRPIELEFDEGVFSSSTTALASPGKCRRRPTPVALLARSCTSARFSPVTRSSMTSMRPPLSL